MENTARHPIFIYQANLIENNSEIKGAGWPVFQGHVESSMTLECAFKYKVLKQKVKWRKSPCITKTGQSLHLTGVIYNGIITAFWKHFFSNRIFQNHFKASVGNYGLSPAWRFLCGFWPTTPIPIRLCQYSHWVAIAGVVLFSGSQSPAQVIKN